MSSYDGFNRAAQAYENEVPGDDPCICEPVVECPNCGECFDREDGPYCQECVAEDEGLILLFPHERVDGESKLSEPGCPLHGYCSGCSSRKCEDCN